MFDGRQLGGVEPQTFENWQPAKECVLRGRAGVKTVGTLGPRGGEV